MDMNDFGISLIGDPIATLHDTMRPIQILKARKGFVVREFRPQGPPDSGVRIVAERVGLVVIGFIRKPS
jgi:hypothetical protein